MSLTPTQLQELQTIVLDLGEEFPHNADALWNTAIRLQTGDLGPTSGSGGQAAFDVAVADIKLCQEEVQKYQQRQGSPSSGFDVAVLQVVPPTSTFPSGNVGEILFLETAPNSYIATDQIVITPVGPNSVQMDEVGTTVFRTVPAASGGIEINNLLTGAGFERVLTVSDTPSGTLPVVTVDNALLVADLAGNDWDEAPNITWDGSQLVLPQNNTPAAPTIALGDGDSGFYEQLDDQINVSLAGVSSYTFASLIFQGNALGAPGLQNSAGSATDPNILVNRSDGNSGFSQPYGSNSVGVVCFGQVGTTWDGKNTFGVVQQHETQAGLTADVGSSQGDGLLESSYNIFATVANAGDAATMPNLPPLGTIIYVKNDGANSMDVFPDVGDNFQGVAVNLAVPVPSGESKTWICSVANATWTEIIVGGGAFDPSLDQDITGAWSFTNAAGDLNLGVSTSLFFRNNADNSDVFLQNLGPTFQFGIAGADFGSGIFEIGSSWLKLQINRSIFFDEKATQGTPVAGDGEFWVRSDTPNVPMFTDDAGTDFVLNAAPAVTQLVDGSANPATVAEGLGITAIRSVGNIDGEGREVEWQNQDGSTRASLGTEFFTDFIMRNHIAGRHLIFQVGTGGGSRIRMHLSGDAAAGGASLYAGTSATPRLQSLNHGVEIGNGTLFLVEQAAQEADIASQGQLWVNSADDSLNYVTEAGVVFDLTAPAAAATELEDSGGNIRLSAETLGLLNLRSVANLDTEARILQFTHQDGTIRGSFGQLAGLNDMRITNNVTSGAFSILLSNGSVSEMYRIEPDPNTAFDTERHRFSDDNGNVCFVINNLAQDDIGMGAQVADDAGTLFPVGMNVMPPNLINTGRQYNLADNGRFCYKNSGLLVIMNMPTVMTDLPNGWTIGIANLGSAGDLRISSITGNMNHIAADGTITTITFGSTWELSPGFVGTLWKESDTETWLWGNDAITGL